MGDFTEKMISVLTIVIPATVSPVRGPHRHEMADMDKRNYLVRTSASIYLTMQDLGAVALIGHKIGNDHNVIVFFKPDRIELYEEHMGHLVCHFPTTGGFWGIKEVLTELFAFVSFEARDDVQEKTSSYVQLFNSFQLDNKNPKEEPTTLFNHDEGIFFGHKYNAVERGVKEDRYVYNYDINDLPQAEDVPARHVTVYIKNN